MAGMAVGCGAAAVASRGAASVGRGRGSVSCGAGVKGGLKGSGAALQHQGATLSGSHARALAARPASSRRHARGGALVVRADAFGNLSDRLTDVWAALKDEDDLSAVGAVNKSNPIQLTRQAWKRKSEREAVCRV
jgi:hypothetical protein